MYSRMLRNVYNVASKLKDHKKIKSSSLVFPNLALTAQRILNQTSNHCSTRHFSDEIDKNDVKNTTEPRTELHPIDQKAQDKINILLAKKPETVRLMKILDLEITVMREDGERVPSALRPRDWYDLLHLDSVSKRKKFLDYLFVIEKQRLKRKEEQVEKSIELEKARAERLANIDPTEIIYGIGNNFMLRRVTEPTMNKLYNWNCLKSIMFGNKIVLDCSYDKLMTNHELKSCAKQIMECYSINRLHNFPFHIHLCNADTDGALIERLLRFIPTLMDDDFPITVTNQSYLEIFPKSSLVYLSSDAPRMVEQYDPESIYIIGSYVDKGAKQPISLGKAKQENIKMAKLPLDKYMHFGDGSGKDLTLNQVFGVMLDIQCSNWDTALLHVPRRKLYEYRVNMLQKRVEREALFGRNQKDQVTADETDYLTHQYTASKRLESNAVSDFSHAARAKLREKWSK